MENDECPAVVVEEFEAIETNISLEEFCEAVEGKVEQMDGLADEEVAAKLIKHELRDKSRSADPRPDKIPSSESVSVSYDELTDREYIGGGGSADVHKATFSAPQTEVTLAIKEPRVSGTLHTDQIDRMLQEADTWSKLDDHDYVVDVVDYDSDPLPWIAMEYMNGGHLGERTGEMELQQALWTAITVTKGVRHAHRKGVAHLDLKPANILFRTIEDGWDVPKVADWGLSKHLLNHSNSVEGLSPQYASPEEFDSKRGSTDDITDIYQLGVVFYELFTGRPPFEGNPAKTMHKVLQQEPTPPSEIADVPSELDDVLLTALAKEKDDRYEDILHLRDDLKSLFDPVTGELNGATTSNDSANEHNTGHKDSDEGTVGESNINDNANTAGTADKQTPPSSNNEPTDIPAASTTEKSGITTESKNNSDLSELSDEIASETQAPEASQLRDDVFFKISDFTDGSLSLRDFTGNMLDIEELRTINNNHIGVLDVQDFVGDIPVRGSSQEDSPN